MVDVPAPVLFGGLAQQNADTGQGIAQGFPKPVAWITAITFVLLLLLTGSEVRAWRWPCSWTPHSSAWSWCPPSCGCWESPTGGPGRPRPLLERAALRE
ncbi:hypothetical protein ACIRRA_22875 [Nocardia sp. NPDC101769]|uniref:hypothetical protein n=1 Tax=Nocardia sp. NPDC101769 TaxID=3364333 RepID=UPI0038285571